VRLKLCAYGRSSGVCPARTALGAGIGFIVATFLSLDETAKAVLIIRVQLECRFAALA
jgi:hypothetical protein